MASRAKPSLVSFSNFVKQFSVHHCFKMHWGEMDAYQHANNVMYFRWQETGRIEHMRKAVSMVRTLPEEAPFNSDAFLRGAGVGPILAATSCRFKAPIFYPDTLCIGSSVKVEGDGALSNSRFTMAHSVWSSTLQRIAAEGTSEIVVYDYVKKEKAPLPAPLRRAFLELEGGKEAVSDAQILDLWREMQPVT